MMAVALAAILSGQPVRTPDTHIGLRVHALATTDEIGFALSFQVTVRSIP